MTFMKNNKRQTSSSILKIVFFFLFFLNGQMLQLWLFVPVQGHTSMHQKSKAMDILWKHTCKRKQTLLWFLSLKFLHLMLQSSSSGVCIQGEGEKSKHFEGEHLTTAICVILPTVLQPVHNTNSLRPWNLELYYNITMYACFQLFRFIRLIIRNNNMNTQGAGGSN